MTPYRPSVPMTTNQTSMIGPNALPIVAVPNRCAANRPTRMTSARGKMYGLSAVVATLTPSSALSTEIAGVMTPSP